MNSVELAYQLRRMSIDSSSSSSSSSVPPPPEMLSATTMSYSSADTAQEFELDCSRFDGLSPAASCASSFDSLSSPHHAAEWGAGGGGLSRSRCAHNLSSLCSAFPSGGARSARQTSSHESGPNASWGYFVDTPSR
eukprot:CAMPEP_0172526318 /NCGR_PEP_ID=MMETSP1067-20121228/1260_1 /TAXON_ID=265564 ORGANISM="Thalassiosira punctigera, Strain Tpunct2005C2" /NCGR_SAMPLE_ID=MMETSP1067 /ASSEMBLY_ACC=CAM_ASM_000444 /LENGTH=135 /DNA_ID=CAMNT_0013309801 /DNA_START=76 /DNA_END=483 /DNA_ORIENTATION=+